jgi:uncharacterized membrane protein
VPFLLSDGTGQVAVLFSYMAIINTGILAIGLLKYWKQLYYSSFSITWIIYTAWFIFNYNQALHFNIALLFATIFFAIFYAIFLAYKLRKQEFFRTDDIILLLSNSFIFYAVIHTVFEKNPATVNYLGLLTAANAGIHLIVGLIIKNKKLVDRRLFYLVIGLALIFITITIPVQLDGNWVTLLWVFEAALLFWIGRSMHVSIYEKLSYPLMLLAFVSIIHDWVNNYAFNIVDSGVYIRPVWNVYMLTSLLFIGAFIFIQFINRKYKSSEVKFEGFSFNPSVVIITILVVVSYFAFYVEIASYWDQLNHSYLKQRDAKMPWQLWQVTNPYGYLKNIWIINYSLAFFAFVLLVSKRKWTYGISLNLSPVIPTFVLLIFLFGGLYSLGALIEIYLNNANALPVYFPVLRYISFTFVAFLLFVLYRNIESGTLVNQGASIYFDLLLHLTIIWILSSEYINLTELANTSQAYKLGLSILWGVYALFVISLGIWKNKKHLRVGAIVLFTLTLAKLFLFDISHLETVAKTIVLVSLGVLLLVISFLYNKYRHLISKNI